MIIEFVIKDKIYFGLLVSKGENSVVVELSAQDAKELDLSNNRTVVNFRRVLTTNIPETKKAKYNQYDISSNKRVKNDG